MRRDAADMLPARDKCQNMLKKETKYKQKQLRKKQKAEKHKKSDMATVDKFEMLKNALSGKSRSKSLFSNLVTDSVSNAISFV